VNKKFKTKFSKDKQKKPRKGWGPHNELNNSGGKKWQNNNNSDSLISKSIGTVAKFDMFKIGGLMITFLYHFVT
jgi:hypothetical protein